MKKETFGIRNLLPYLRKYRAELIGMLVTCALGSVIDIGVPLFQRYALDRFPFDVLKEEYGIYAVRGPRGIPNSLSAALKK